MLKKSKKIHFLKHYIIAILCMFGLTSKSLAQSQYIYESLGKIKLSYIWVFIVFWFFIFSVLINFIKSNAINKENIIQDACDSTELITYELPYKIKSKNRLAVIVITSILALVVVKYMITVIQDMVVIGNTIQVSMPAFFMIIILIIALILIILPIGRFSLSMELSTEKLLLTKLGIFRKEIIISNIIKRVNIYRIAACSTRYSQKRFQDVIGIFIKQSKAPIIFPINSLDRNEVRQIIGYINNNIKNTECEEVPDIVNANWFLIILMAIVALIIEILVLIAIMNFCVI